MERASKEKQPEKGRRYKAKEDWEMTQLDPLVEGHQQRFNMILTGT